MLDLNEERKVCGVLNDIMEHELAGVVRYTHYSLMVFGPFRIPVVDFFKQQAAESLSHAQQVGEILTGLGGHPSLDIASIIETNKHDISDILDESLQHEKIVIEKYYELLKMVQGKSIHLEEYARGMIGQEESHVLELRKMLRDFIGP